MPSIDEILPELTDEAVERWLREEALPALQAHQADPSECIPIDEVFDRIEARLKAREAKAR
jgi:hypothetical protein